MPDVLIIGGGITGVSAAYEIARAGHSVTLLEKRHLGAMASGWTLGGVRQSGRHPAELPLAIEAVKRWMTLDTELDAPTGYRQGGNIRLARDESEVEIIRELVAEQGARGLDLDFLADNKAIRTLAPAIGPDILAASFCRRDGHADPDLTVAAYAAAARRHGADIREGIAARAVRIEAGRIVGVETSEGVLFADRVILAAGIHTPELLAGTGLALPLSVQRVCVLQTVPVEPAFSQVFGVANANAAGRQEVSGRFRVTNGIEPWRGDPSGWSIDNLQPNIRDVTTLVDRITQILPMLAGIGFSKVWGGLIDLTPDALPVIDAHTGVEGLIIAAGFSGHGFGIGPVTGEILGDLTQGRQPRFALAEFRCDRFGSAQHWPSLTLHG